MIERSVFIPGDQLEGTFCSNGMLINILDAVEFKSSFKVQTETHFISTPHFGPLLLLLVLIYRILFAESLNLIGQ